MKKEQKFCNSCTVVRNKNHAELFMCIFQTFEKQEKCPCSECLVLPICRENCSERIKRIENLEI